MNGPKRFENSVLLANEILIATVSREAAGYSLTAAWELLAERTYAPVHIAFTMSIELERDC